MMSRSSPYAGQPAKKWKEITQSLLAVHPLKENVILEVALLAWQKVWATTIGTGRTAIRLTDLDVPATVIGYFFEVLFAKEMENRFPGQWRGTRNKEEKDLVYIPDLTLSVELKTSGQLGYKVYGNRSYGQKLQKAELAKKEKSGYYITMNFYKRTLTLLRFGWIDASDWRPQASPTGQMAGLSDKVYQNKLVVIAGDYRLDAPLRLLSGVGPATAEQFQKLGIRTIRELLGSPKLSVKRLEAIRASACREYQVAAEPTGEESGTEESSL